MVHKAFLLSSSRCLPCCCTGFQNYNWPAKSRYRRHLERVSASGAATNTDISLLLDLPDDPRLRVLVGVPLDDHRALAASCRSLRAVMHAPQFLRARKQWRFAERRVVYVKDHTISVHRDPADNILEVCVAGNVIASISGMTDGSWSPYAGAAVPAGLVRYAPGSVILGS